MRKLLWIGVFAVAASLASASPARAGALGFTGTLGVVIANLPPITITGAGTALVSGTGTALEGLELPAGVFATLASIPVDDPSAFPIGGVLASVSTGAGSFGGSLLGGAMPVFGRATLCLLAACDASPAANVVVPFTQDGTHGLGLGGPPITSSGFVNVTITFSPWTIGQATVGGASVAGFVHGPNGGGAAAAAQAGGSVQLVTPIAIQTSIPGSEEMAAFGILTLQFVPEPGTLVLLAAGVAGLGLAGRSRLRG